MDGNQFCFTSQSLCVLFFFFLCVCFFLSSIRWCVLVLCKEVFLLLHRCIFILLFFRKKNVSNRDFIKHRGGDVSKDARLMSFPKTKLKVSMKFHTKNVPKPICDAEEKICRMKKNCRRKNLQGEKNLPRKNSQREKKLPREKKVPREMNERRKFNTIESSVAEVARQLESFTGHLIALAFDLTIAASQIDERR